MAGWCRYHHPNATNNGDKVTFSAGCKCVIYGDSRRKYINACISPFMASPSYLPSASTACKWHLFMNRRGSTPHRNPRKREHRGASLREHDIKELETASSIAYQCS